MISIRFQNFEASMSTVYFDMLLWISDTKFCFMHLPLTAAHLISYSLWGLRGWDHEYLPSSQRHHNCFISNSRSEKWVAEMLLSLKISGKILIKNFITSIEWNWFWNVDSYFNDVSDKVLSKYHEKVYTAFSNFTVHEKPGQNPGKVSAIIH